jgi:hypothetical protein
LRRLATELPLSALVLETDAPDIAPHWIYRTAAQRAAGEVQGRNEPGELPAIAAEVAALRGITVETLAGATWKMPARRCRSWCLAGITRHGPDRPCFPPDVHFSDEGPIRHLHLDSIWIQGSMLIDAPQVLVHQYIQRMMAWLLFVEPASVPNGARRCSWGWAPAR